MKPAERPYFRAAPPLTNEGRFYGQPDKTVKIEMTVWLDMGRNTQQIARQGLNFGAHVKIDRFFR